MPRTNVEGTHRVGGDIVFGVLVPALEQNILCKGGATSSILYRHVFFKIIYRQKTKNTQQQYFKVQSNGSRMINNSILLVLYSIVQQYRSIIYDIIVSYP